MKWAILGFILFFYCQYLDNKKRKLKSLLALKSAKNDMRRIDKLLKGYRRK